MTTFQKAVKYIAIALAVLLIVTIFSGIFGAIGALNFFTGSTLTTMEDYPLQDRFTELELNIGAAELTVAEGTGFSLSSNLKDLEIMQDNGILTLRETKQFGKNYNGAKLNLTIPEGYTFEQIHIFSGAGKVTLSRLSANVLTMHLGAGQVTADRLNAEQSALITTGAGELTVHAGHLNNLDMELGVGKTTLKTRLTGKSEIEQGVGETDIELIGTAQEYTVQTDAGIGSITVDGLSKTGDGSYGSGPNRVEIDSGIGSIRVRITEDSVNN